jgi:hypothetical protein
VEFTTTRDAFDLGWLLKHSSSLRPDLFVILVHQIEKFGTCFYPTLDSSGQDDTLHGGVALVGYVVTEPTSSTRSPTTARAYRHMQG